MRWLPVAGCWLAIAGCGGNGPERVSVRGTVRVDGTLLEKGAIVFIPAGNTQGPKASGTITGGMFEISEADGPVVGSQRVEIRTEPELGFALDDPEAFRRQPGPDLPPDPIPDQYNNQSTLVIDTTASGENHFDFNISTATN